MIRFAIAFVLVFRTLLAPALLAAQAPQGEGSAPPATATCGVAGIVRIGADWNRLPRRNSFKRTSFRRPARCSRTPSFAPIAS